MKPRARSAPAHHQRSNELPLQSVTLPPAAQRAAQRHPLLAGLFPSHIGFFPKARHHRVERAGIEPTIVVYCVGGGGFCELLGRRIRVEPGDVLVVPSAVPHIYGSLPDKPWSIYWFHAMGGHLPALLAELGASVQKPSLHIGHRRELVALFSELCSSLENDYSEPRLLYASRVLAYLLGVMICARTESSARKRQHQRAGAGHHRAHAAALRCSAPRRGAGRHG